MFGDSQLNLTKKEDIRLNGAKNTLLPIGEKWMDKKARKF